MATEDIATLPSQRAYSDSVWVMFRPAAAYSALAVHSDESTRWRAVWRGLWRCFLLGCMVSLIVSQRLTVRLVAAGSLNSTFIPLVETAGLFVVWRGRRIVSFSHAVDLFSLGHGPWIFGIFAFATVWAFATPQRAYFWTTPHRVWPFLVLAFVWSASVDYEFFRRVFQRDCARAILDLMTQRTISWGLGILIFGAGPLAAHIVSVIRR